MRFFETEQLQDWEGQKPANTILIFLFYKPTTMAQFSSKPSDYFLHEAV